MITCIVTKTFWAMGFHEVVFGILDFFVQLHRFFTVTLNTHQPISFGRTFRKFTPIKITYFIHTFSTPKTGA